MNNILKYILDSGLVAPIAVITMTLVYYFESLLACLYKKEKEWIIKKRKI